MAKANLNREEVEMLITSLASVITIKHRYRNIKLDYIDTKMLMGIIDKLENPPKKKNDLELLRQSEAYHDTTSYLGPQKCEDCND